MALSAGARFGPYEVVDLLGAGGMGEVYRARDARLKREVAIKVLPDGGATDPERLARFHREAELLASLNHPHIAAIYGLEHSDGVTALVLELIEGDTLADRLARGPMRLKEALDVASQLVEALDAAHGKGVIHRDLKPANIKITPDDKVKVLDFGLAAVVQQNSGVQDVNVTHSPTLPLGATRAGVIIGTAAYMSPEQAHARLPTWRGADHRHAGSVDGQQRTNDAIARHSVRLEQPELLTGREPPCHGRGRCHCQTGCVDLRLGS